MDALRHIVRVLRVASRAAEKRVGLSAAQVFVLQRLADGDPLSVGELAARTFTDQSSVSVVVTRLVQRGLVRRRRSRVDRRRRELALTPAGRALVRRSPPAGQEQILTALEQFAEPERRALAHTLRRLVVRIGGAEGVPAMFFEDTGPSSVRRRRRGDAASRVS